VDGQDVGSLEARIELDEFGTDALGALLADVGVVGDDVHPQRVEFLGDLLADAAEADDAERLAVEFGAEVVAFRPLAVFRRMWACGIERALANVIATVCSAAARTFPSGALATMTPLSVAASMSMLSTPMPARPTIASSSAALRGLPR